MLRYLYQILLFTIIITLGCCSSNDTAINEEDSLCPICYEQMGECENTIAKLSCNHSLCLDCWTCCFMENIEKCPICRNQNLQSFLSNITHCSILIIKSICNKTYSEHKLSHAFHNFLTYGNLGICKYLLLYYNINFNLKNKLGNEPIHSLILSTSISYKKKFEFFKYLIRNADIYEHARNDRGESILHYAAGINHFELVEFLLSRNFYVGQTDNSGNNVLTHAISTHSAEHNILKMVKMLVDKYSANMYSENIDYISPLYMSIIFEYYTIFNYFYQRMNRTYTTAHLTKNYFDRKHFLHQIITEPTLSEDKKLFIIEYLVSNFQLHPNVIELKTGRTLIHSASNRGYFKIIKYLSQFTQVDSSDDEGNTALFFVISSKYISENEKIEILDFLINVKNANPTHKNFIVGKTILHVSATLGFEKIMSYLLANTSLNLIQTADDNGNSVLFYLLGSQIIDKHKKFDILKQFIPTLKINDFNLLRDEWGGTLLHLSMYKNYFAITEYLLFSTNLDINVIDYNKNTALAAFLFTSIEEHVKSITLKFYVEKYGANILLLTKNDDLMDYLKKSECFKILDYMLSRENKSKEKEI